MGAEVQRVAAAGVVHVDMPPIQEQRLAFFGVAERSVATFVGKVVGLGLDDPRGQPQVAVAVTDDLAQQGLGQGLGVAVEKAVGQGWHAGQFVAGEAGMIAMNGLIEAELEGDVGSAGPFAGMPAPTGGA